MKETLNKAVANDIIGDMKGVTRHITPEQYNEMLNKIKEREASDKPITYIEQEKERYLKFINHINASPELSKIKDELEIAYKIGVLSTQDITMERIRNYLTPLINILNLFSFEHFLEHKIEFMSANKSINDLLSIYDN